LGVKQVGWAKVAGGWLFNHHKTSPMYNSRFNLNQPPDQYQPFHDTPPAASGSNITLNSGVFLGGSSSAQYDDLQYRYLSATGGPSTGSSRAHSSSTDATRLSINEGLILADQSHAQPPQNTRQPWQWAPAPEPAGAEPAFAPPNAYLVHDKRPLGAGGLSYPPADPIANSMAIQFNANASLSTALVPLTTAASGADAPPPPRQSMHQETDSSRSRASREKKHGCWMCHKSFDRPSTLRKASESRCPRHLETETHRRSQ
jgi:hypothetical protein